MVEEVDEGAAELCLNKADSSVILSHGAGASSSRLSALTYDTGYVCDITAGGDEQSAEDHLARRRDGETAGLPDVHSIKGREPSLHCNVTFLSTQIVYGPELRRWC